MKPVAVITEALVIDRILRHLGWTLGGEPPQRRAARCQSALADAAATGVTGHGSLHSPTPGCSVVVLVALAAVSLVAAVRLIG